MKLFAEDAPWAHAAHHVDVFKLCGEWAGRFATDAELREVVTDLNRCGIAIAFEAGALIPTETCGAGVEGFGAPSGGIQTALRIKAAGGTVRSVALDEPFAFGSIYSGPKACHWTAEKVAQQVVNYIRGIKTIFPNVIVGDIEPLWAGVSVDTYKYWLQTYRAVTGSQLSFFHIDNDFTRPDWAEAAKELEDFSHNLGISFGIIYLGKYDDTSDGEWVGHAEERMVTYEIQIGGRPDHVIFQSCYDHPDYLLPETDPTTFTHLIDRYFRTRTTLILAPIALRSNGSMQVSGVLTDWSGLPVSGAVVEVAVTPVDGPGVFAEYAISGIVSHNATRANVGFRVNTECKCLGTTDFSLYAVHRRHNRRASGESSSPPWRISTVRPRAIPMSNMACPVSASRALASFSGRFLGANTLAVSPGASAGAEWAFFFAAPSRISVMSAPPADAGPREACWGPVGHVGAPNRRLAQGPMLSQSSRQAFLRETLKSNMIERSGETNRFEAQDRRRAVPSGVLCCRSSRSSRHNIHDVTPRMMR